MSTGSTAGSWERSASRWQSSSYPCSSPTPSPARYATPSPSFIGRCNTWIRPSSAATRSATPPVPSGLLSSTTSTSASGSVARVRRSHSSMFSASS